MREGIGYALVSLLFPHKLNHQGETNTTFRGTWVLTEEDVLEPPKKLKEALKRKGIPETGVFDICEIGESREFS